MVRQGVCQGKIRSRSRSSDPNRRKGGRDAPAGVQEPANGKRSNNRLVSLSFAHAICVERKGEDSLKPHDSEEFLHVFVARNSLCLSEKRGTEITHLRGSMTLPPGKLQSDGGNLGREKACGGTGKRGRSPAFAKPELGGKTWGKNLGTTGNPWGRTGDLGTDEGETRGQGRGHSPPFVNPENTAGAQMRHFPLFEFQKTSTKFQRRPTEFTFFVPPPHQSIRGW